MKKNWLIRTKSNHILGPVSKEKVLELYQNGSIKADDEICSGNGYWFFIREDDLVNRYLLGEEEQSFNPTCELISQFKNEYLDNQKEINEGKSDDATRIGHFSLKDLKDNSLSSKKFDEGSVLGNPAPSESSQKKIEQSIDSKSKPVDKNAISKIPKDIKINKNKEMKKQKWLKILGVWGFLVLFFLIYFRKSIIQKFLSLRVSYPHQLSSLAQAQESISSKKKAF
jgi:hypothetical protein